MFGIDDNLILMMIYLRVMCYSCILRLLRCCFKKENMKDSRYLLVCLMNIDEIFLVRFFVFKWIYWGRVVNFLLVECNNR